MSHHSAYKLNVEQLDVVVVEDSKPMQTVLRSILMPLRLDRTRVYESGDEALQAMLNEPPNLVITDWRMRPTSGYQLLRAMRQKQLAPLCNVPVIFVTAHATRPLIEKAMRAGAHHLLAKPLSPARLHDCINWILRDPRELIVDEAGNVGIEGVAEAFDTQHKKLHSLNRARAIHKHMTQRAATLQTEIDGIIAEPAAKRPEPALQKDVSGTKALELSSRHTIRRDFAQVRPKNKNAAAGNS